MPRVILSEFRAKNLVFAALEQKYLGLAVDLENVDYQQQIAKLPKDGLYVVKVDQAVKKRNKKGLVTVKRSSHQLLGDLKAILSKGYRYAIVEPYIAHDSNNEHYISLLRTELGIKLSYSPKGGVDIEENSATLQHSLLSVTDFIPRDNNTELDNKLVAILYELFQSSHMTLLEINPCVIEKNNYLPLDAAVEVDTAAQFFVDGAWSDLDIRKPMSETSLEERNVEVLNAQSPASLNLKVLNPNGSLFLLLSGGGASVVIADEIAARGQHADIANYGEYSGNPSEEETYSYTRELFNLMLKSKSPRKVLLIAGGVANFTDVAKTFSGIIRAIVDYAETLSKQKLTVIIRRGGPNQEQGLKAIKGCLDQVGISNKVYGPEISLASAVTLAIESLK